MALKPSLERLQDAHSAYELLWLLDLSRFVPGADHGLQQVLRATFLAGTLHAAMPRPARISRSWSGN
jgi:hypothetical protein